jgi:hypothetical protein
MVESNLLLEASCVVSIYVLGKKKEPLKWLIYEHQGSLEIYDSYFKFTVHKISSQSGKNEGYITHLGIIPFDSIKPVKNYVQLLIKNKQIDKKVKKLDYFTHADSLGRRYFQFFFDAKQGWQNIPNFMSGYTGSLITQLNQNLLKSQEEYQNILQESYIGPYIGVSIGIDKTDDSQDFLDDILEIFKVLQIENPQNKIDGQIKVSF